MISSQHTVWVRVNEGESHRQLNDFPKQDTISV